MQVILMEKVANLGNLGDVVKVKDGYARNYLIPHGKAKRATDENLKASKRAGRRWKKRRPKHSPRHRSAARSSTALRCRSRRRRAWTDACSVR